MRPQVERDRKTLVISTALGLFVVIVGAGGTALWAVHALVGVSDELTNALVTALVCAAAVLSVLFLLRADKP